MKLRVDVLNQHYNSLIDSIKTSTESYFNYIIDETNSNQNFKQLYGIDYYNLIKTKSRNDIQDDYINMRFAILTIDDSPTENTSNLSAFLAERSIPAVFFCIGSHIETYPEACEKIIKNGHIIGNHSYSHANFSKLSFDECITEIERTEEIIDTIYKTTGLIRSRRYFRFPYGNKGGHNKNSIQNYLKKREFNRIHLNNTIEYPWYNENGLNEDIDVFWTFDCEDYRIPLDGDNYDMKNVLMHINEYNPNMGGSLASGVGSEIILMHDNSETNAKFPEYYKTIINTIEKMGICFNDSDQGNVKN